MRLTPPFNLPAPGRRQTLYVVFDLAESCVFSKQSPGPLYCNSFPLTGQSRITGWSTPSSEVTGRVCRVPGRGFSLAPWDFLPAYLCRFTVRVPERLLRGFSWQHGITRFAAFRPRHGTSGNANRRICLAIPPTCLNLHVQSQAGLASCVPPSYKRRPGSSGMLTGYPSATPFGLALGPD